MTERQQRRLAAILAADIAGYSALMGSDEEATVRDLKAHQSVILPMIKEQGGRVIDTAGDGILAEFPSVLNAVKCAVAIQKTMAERNAVIDPARQMQFRIGVNQGDVVFDDARVYGDGVNVAARLEGIADPGGICVSGKVHDEIRGKIDIPLMDIGAQQLKNIAEPVRVYRVELRNDPHVLPLRERALSLPDKPSIAVLPFANISGDKEQEYFADGIVEEITTALSRFPSLFVIARNSSFSYKGKATDIKHVGRDLGVRYVLEGSVRKAGNKIRITGQLIQADTGSHIWAERYEGDLTDIFELQDQITSSVAGAIVPSLQKAEIERAQRKSSESLKAYDLYLRALPHLHAMTLNGNGEAVTLLKQSIILDPTFALAASSLSYALLFRVVFGWSAHSDVEDDAVHYARLALSLNKENSEILARYAGTISFFLGQRHEAVGFARRAVDLNPNSSVAWRASGYVHLWDQQAAVAVEHFSRALRLSPRDSLDFHILLGKTTALLEMGRDKEALETAQQAIHRAPHYPHAWRVLAASFAVLGKISEARLALAEHERLAPKVTLTQIRLRHQATLHATTRYFEGLRMAGLPE